MRAAPVILGLFLFAASCAPGEESPYREAGPTAGATRRATSVDERDAVQGCQFPRYRPTYLPWLEEGSPIPEPSRERLPGGGHQGLDPAYAILVWGLGDISTPGGPPLEGTLSLSRATESVGAIPADPRVPPLPDGAQGRLYAGEGGDWSIVWVDPFPSPYDDPCSETTLSLAMSNLSPEAQRREILRVARSLAA